MPLMVRLGANEKMVINGAVVSVEGGRAAKIVVHNNACVLRGKDVLTAEQVDTPVKRIYFAVQMLYIDSDAKDKYFKEFTDRLTDVIGVTGSEEIRQILYMIQAYVETGAYYNALAALRRVLEYENRLLTFGSDMVVDES